MKKLNLFFALVVLLAMIPLTYVAARGRRGGYRGRGGRRSYHGYRHHGRRGYYRRGYYNPAWWAIPTAIGIAATAAAASSDDTDDTTYYPNDYEMQEDIMETAAE